MASGSSAVPSPRLVVVAEEILELLPATHILPAVADASGLRITDLFSFCIRPSVHILQEVLDPEFMLPFDLRLVEGADLKIVRAGVRAVAEALVRF